MAGQPFAGEFGRVKKNGDFMRGNLDHRTHLAEFGDGLPVPVQYAAIRRTGNDLEFYDTTVGAWVKLSQLAGHLGDVHEIVAGVGQTAFNLPYSYVVGSNTMMVFLNGMRLPGPSAPTPVYVESGVTQVTLNSPVAPWTPLVGNEVMSFIVAGRPVVNDTYTVKGDGADLAPNYLPQKLQQAGAVQITTVGSPANTKAQVDVPFATVVPPASAGAGAVGVSVKVAKEDHQHPAVVAGPYLYDEATNGAGFVAGAGPNHVITIAAGVYPLGISALVVFHNGAMIPLSKITELTTTTYQINGLGVLAATDIVTTRIPVSASPPATVGQGSGFSAAPAAPFLVYNWSLGTRRLSIVAGSVKYTVNRDRGMGRAILDVVTGQIDSSYVNITASGGLLDTVGGINKIAAVGDNIVLGARGSYVQIQAINLVTRSISFSCNFAGHVSVMEHA